ncbi:MAG: hypothetical protein VX938_04515, partial [Myxococcota bacterium]|nr:hypothetical protein [Myxococcota bacterium]
MTSPRDPSRGWVAVLMAVAMIAGCESNTEPSEVAAETPAADAGLPGGGEEVVGVAAGGDTLSTPQ